MHSNLRALVPLLALLLVTACGDLSQPVRAVRSASLVRVNGCEDAARALKARAAARMERRLAENLAYALGGGCIGFPGVPGSGGPTGPAGPQPPQPSEDGDGPAERSGTNDQEAGVDEPDLVKSDGSFLYVVADGDLQIVRAWPAGETHRVTRLDVPGTAKRLLLRGDRAVVFSSLPSEATPPSGPGAPLPLVETPWPPECTYGYDCVPQGDGTPLAVSFIDVADRAAPRIVRETRFSGSYLAARRIDGAVHVVVTSPERWFEGLDHGEGLACAGLKGTAVRTAFDALRARNRRIIDETDVSAWLPSAVDVSHAGAEPTEREVRACGEVFAAPEAEGTAFLTVASYDLDDDWTIATTTTLGQPGFVYAARDALYVAAPQQWWGGPWFFASADRFSEATTIHAFGLRGAPLPGSEYLASGAVEGRILNTFALDEHEGDLRVATTTGFFGPGMSSAVTVLRRDGATLEELGAVRGIAPGEDIRAVRFDGDRAFVVTFERTDPLFVVDLAEPAAPRVAGEVVVPGFSTYLHLVDPSHLLTIGFDAADDGPFSWFQGVRLQLFDVADPTRPALDHAAVIGSRGSASEAATDHLAFTWFAPKGLLAVPIVVCDGDAGGGVGTEVSFSGLYVYRVSPEGGFARLGGVAHPLPASDPWAAGACDGWWTRSTSLVKRSVFHDDFVYSIAPHELRVQDTRALGTDLARVDLAAP